MTTPKDELNELFVVNTAIECNNIGAELLSSGRLRPALESFVGALKLMGLLCSGLNELIKAISTDSRYFEATGTTTGTPLHRTRDQCSQILTEARTKLVDLHSSPTVAIIENELCYDPLTLDFIEEHTVTEIKSFRLQAAAIASNVGLIYQLCADFPFLQRSICIYDFAFSMALSAKQPSILFTRIACLCLFNSGVIHHDLGNLQSCRSCIDTLRVHIRRLPYGHETRFASERLESISNLILSAPRN